ncbi:MAG TPA: peptidoglycan-associated lipoprotein Pal [Steroidobacteraceae bacterium]|nr:peptidoglycan-associated lipoprotein Pal [Steroidobacteraceae bacterium]
MRKVLQPFGTALLLSLALLIAGCPSKTTTQPEAPPAPTEAPPAQTTDTTAAEAAEAARRAAEQRLLAQTVIYFDFDRSDIRPEYAEVIAAHARKLAAAPNLKVRLEGHTDERGSREYNIGLGERRAQSVRRAMLLQSAGDGQLNTVSYGEERPAVDGHDEGAWAKNRRVEIVYQ